MYIYIYVQSGARPHIDQVVGRYNYVAVLHTNYSITIVVRARVARRAWARTLGIRPPRPPQGRVLEYGHCSYLRLSICMCVYIYIHTHTHIYIYIYI